MDRVFDARPDAADFRDRMYVPTLVEVPEVRPLAAWTKLRVPVLNQGREGACTGYALATVVHALLRTRAARRDLTLVSARMLYDMARRHDEWPGERYEGSSARGAMKGWHKHGACAEKLWPSKGTSRVRMDESRARDGALRPLGAYFRVNHLDLVAMHAALTETGALFVTSEVHDGWDAPDRRTGRIRPRKGSAGHHAFAIVGWDADGFWIQNSWGASWGKRGLAHLPYEDWLSRGTDAWVARIGVPVRMSGPARLAVSHGGAAGSALDVAALRPHVATLGNDGLPFDSGPLGTSEADIRTILREDFPRLTKGWARRRLVVHVHGGLVPSSRAHETAARLAAKWLPGEAYPLAIVWRTGFWDTLRNVLGEAARRRRPEGIIDTAKEFLEDRLDAFLEPVARTIGGRTLWKEMKENARLASRAAGGGDPAGGARVIAEEAARLAAADPSFELHVVGHSAGSVLIGHMLDALHDAGGPAVRSAALWAPACTMRHFANRWAPALDAGRVARLLLMTLDDATERRDDCLGLYRKSLLYLVSNAFEDDARAPFEDHGEPLLGMEAFVRADAAVAARFAAGGRNRWMLAPQAGTSLARSHGAFDDDTATLETTLAWMRGG
ncbi:MAG: hypothetical protein HMLKMBBP_03819 [Planctomycetes bacterium]|nr:hypothetical protein [Planctomycetota bacterium]